MPKTFLNNINDISSLRKLKTEELPELAKELRLFISFSADEFVNSKDHATEAIQIKNILKNFAKEYFQTYADEEIKNLTKDVAKLDKNLAKVDKTIAKEQKSKSKAESKIAKLQAKIKKTEAKIIKSQESINGMQKSAEEERSEIEEIDTNHSKLTKEKEEAAALLKEETIVLEALKSKLAKIAAY
jgi:septal ring factor EnvC (AmiA/AmiB activator)